MSEPDKYKEALRRIYRGELGIFPTAVLSGPGAYAKRTEYQEGWNDALIRQTEEIERILHDLDIDIAELD